MNRPGVFVLVLLTLLGGAQRAHAEWLLVPFAGAALGTDTGFFDLDGIAGRSHVTYGIALTFRPERVFGGELTASVIPSAFTGHDLVDSSRVLTAMGSVVIALPKRWSPRLRPYATIGAGLVHVAIADIAGVFPIDSTRAGASAGAGVWLALAPRVGARVDARFIRSGSAPESNRLETWQTTFGATVRF